MTTSVDQAMGHLQDLVMAATEPDLTGAVQANRARTVAETAADIHDMMTVASGLVLPGLVADSVDGADDAVARKELRARIERLTRDNPVGFPRVKPDSDKVDPTATGTGSDGGLPIVRRLAGPLAFENRIVPALPDPATTGTVNPSGSGDSADVSITIDDATSGKSQPDWAMTCFPTSKQLLSFTAMDAAARALLDQAMYDVVDRAAEIHIGNTLATAATASTTTTGDLAARLDADEGQASAGAGTVADLLFVNPLDWPAVRRAVAPVWTAGLPHPTPFVTVGVPAGTVITAASAALIIQVGPLTITSTTTVSFTEYVSGGRYFRGIVRWPAGLVKTTIAA